MTEAAEPPPAPPPEPPSVAALALAFNRLAFESIGGGLAAWSQKMIVEEKRWMSEEEFLSTSTICNILPGANQINMAVFVGTKYRGLPGALAAVGGLVALPAAAALVIGALFLEFRHYAGVRHFLTGMSCAAVALAVSVAWHQGRHTLTSWPAFALGLATFLAAVVLRLPLWLTIAVLAPLGFWWGWQRPEPLEPGEPGP